MGVGGKYDGDAEMPGSTVSSGCTMIPELPGGQVKKGSLVCYAIVPSRQSSFQGSWLTLAFRI